MKFSIIIPAYNVEKTIDRAIKSIIKQTFHDYEIIVINDNSRDNTSECVKKYKQVKLIENKEQLKAGGSRNVGIENSQGEYIIFLDADDYFYDENVLAKINDNMQNATYEMLYLGFIKNIDGEFKESYIPMQEQENKENRLLKWKYPNVWDVCWNREFINNNNMRFEEKRYIAEDALFYFQGIIKANKFKVIDIISHIYTINSNSLSTTTQITFEKMYDFYYMISQLYKFTVTVPEIYKKIFLKKIREQIDYANRLATKLEKSQK